MIVLYALLLIGVVLRFSAQVSRTFVLFRPFIFCGVRIGTFVVRVIDAHDYGNGKQASIGTIIAEQVMLSVGFIMLMDPLVVLLFNHRVGRHVTYHSRKDHMRRITAITIRWMLIGAIACGIAAGVKLSSTTTDASAVNSVKVIQRVAASLSLVCAATMLFFVLSLLIVHTKVQLEGSRAGTLYLLFIASLLVVVPSYRLSVVANSHSTSSLAYLISNPVKIKFYVLQVLPELIVSIAYILINLRATYDTDEEQPIPPWRVEELQSQGIYMEDKYNQGTPPSSSAPLAEGGAGHTQPSQSALKSVLFWGYY